MISQLKTQVDENLKNAFVQLAQKKNLSEAALLRELVLAATATESQASRVAIGTEREPSSITVYVPRFLKKSVEQRAKAKYLTTSAWVASLLQSNLAQQPVMTHNQLAALNASIRELASIGRNVNQIAKALNQRPGEVGLDRAALASIRAEIRSHELAVRELVKVSERSWSAGI